MPRIVITFIAATLLGWVDLIDQQSMLLQQFPGALLVEERSGAAELLRQKPAWSPFRFATRGASAEWRTTLPDQGARGLFVVHHDLVDLLTGADTGDHGLRSCGHRSRGSDVDEPATTARFGTKDSPTLAMRTAAKRVNGVIEAEHEARAMSSVVMVTRTAVADLIVEEGNDGPAGRHHVAVAHGHQAGVRCTAYSPG